MIEGSFNALLVILILTYFVLIWRINKLIVVIEGTKSVYRDMYMALSRIKSAIVGTQKNANDIKDGGISLEGETERFGKINIRVRP